MDEQKSENKTWQGLPGHPEGCFCHGCRFGGMYGHHRFRLLRLLILIVAFAIVFCLGLKLGEFKGAFGGYYRNEGPRHMMFWGDNPQYYPSGMMNGWTAPNMMYFQATTTPKTTK